MSNLMSLGSGAVARSLKVTPSTTALVATIDAAVAANAMIAMPRLTGAGQTAVLAVVFCSVALATFMLSTDLLGRSGQAVASLRSVGATRKAVSTVLLTAVIVYAAGGAAIGAGAGAALGAAFARAGLGMAIGGDVVAVTVIAAGATVAGVYAGARRAWRR